MSQRIQVLEYSNAVVDAELGVIKGVKIIGVKSENGYGYPAGVLRKAKALYENAPVFVLHPDARERKNGDRQLADHFGSLKNVRERGFANQITGLFGDLHVKLSHPLAAGVLEAAPTARFGLSHNAIILMNDDQSEVTEILGVNSVDLVPSPATSKNLFEEHTVTSLENMEIAPMSQEGLEQFSDQVAQKVLEAIKEETGSAHRRVRRKGGGATRKSPRLSALEDRTGDPETSTGNTHADFLGALRGFPVTNR